MIFWYSASGSSEVFAEVLGQIASEPTNEIITSFDAKPKPFIRAAFASFLALAFGKIPNLFSIFEDNKKENEKFFIVCPVWAGRPAFPVFSLLEAEKFKKLVGDAPINMLLTAAAPSPKQAEKATKKLKALGLTPGIIESFAGKGAKDREIIEEHIKKIYFENV